MKHNPTGSRFRTGTRYSEAGAAAFALFQELEYGALPDAPGVSRGRFALLRVLATDGPLTMSEVARRRRISRQGVKLLADALCAQGKLRQTENPRHKRAPLLELTEAGLAAYRELAEREARRLNELARGLSADELRSAARVLALLRKRAEAAARGRAAQQQASPARDAADQARDEEAAPDAASPQRGAQQTQNPEQA